MPIYVELPRNKGIAEFPDNTSEDDIMRAVKRDTLLDDQAASKDVNTRDVYLDELGNQMWGNLQQAGIGVAQGFARLGQGGNKLLELAVRQFGAEYTDEDRASKEALIEQFKGASDISGQMARDLGALSAETEGSELPRDIAAGVVSSTPSLIAAPLGMAAAVSTAAIQQFGTSFADYEQHYLEAGVPETEARGRAFAPALASGLITGLVTAGYGRTGIEALRNAGPKVFSEQLRGILREAGLEGMEEFTDEVWQTVVEEVTIDPDKDPQEVLGRALTAFSAGLVAGGGMQAVLQASPAPEGDATSSAVKAEITPEPEPLGEAAAQELLEVTQTRAEAPRTEMGEVVPEAPPVDALDPVTVAEATPEAELPVETDTFDPETVEQLQKEITPPTVPAYEPLPKGETPATTDLSMGIVPPNTAIIRETPVPPTLQAAVKHEPKDFTLFNRINSPQWTFWFGKLGEAAKGAWERMALGEFEMRERIARDTQFYVDDVLARLPREWRAAGGQAFFDLLDGATIEEVNARPIGQEVKDMAARVKTRLEEIRVSMRDLKRTSFQHYLEGKSRDELVDMYIANVDPNFNREVLDQRNITKQILAQNIATHTFPDDWGISDGTYLMHMFIGHWKASATVDGEQRFVLRGETVAEAQSRLRDYVRANPEMANAKFTIEPNVSIPADITRLGDKQFFSLINDMGKKMGLDTSEVRDSTMGIIGRKASKQKFFGNLKHRYGAKNYERDFRKAFTAYLYGFHRWQVLSRVNRDAQPLIEKVRGEGRSRAANELEDILKQMWGTPDEATLEFDAFLQRIPIVRDYVRPLAMNRWLRAVRTVGATAMLTTPKFAVLQRLQPLQGLYPLVGERLMFKAKMLQHSREGRVILDHYGVDFDTGQYGEPTIKTKLSKWRETFLGERGNQEIAFLALYLHGLQTNLAPDEAAAYAKLRGQLMTQFTPLISDTPKFLRGPIGATVFQFKRFPIKQLELLASFVRDRNVPGVVRMMGAFALIGGLSFYLKSVFTDKDRKLEIKKTLDERLGTDTADMLMYGLPGLANVDLSGSLILLDEPFGDSFYEKLGRTVSGPAPSLGLSLIQTLSAEQRAPRGVNERILDTMRRLPALKGLVDLYRVARGNRDVTTADGEVAYRRTLQDVLVNLGSFRSASESNNRLAVDGVAALEEERARLKNRLFVRIAGDGDPAELFAEIDNFNKRWPEAAINADEMVNYFKLRAKGLNQTDLDRVMKKRYRGLLPPQPEAP